MKSRYFILFLTILISIRGYNQETKITESIISVAEALADDDTDSEALGLFTGNLSDLSDDPVHINSASADEISRLFFLSDFQVRALADYVRTTGKIVSFYELMNIPGFDKETTEMMIPFISLSTWKGPSSDSSKFRSSILTNFSIRSSRDSSKSFGSQWKILSKYKFKTGNLSGGITVEKDPGEAFISGSPPCPDFVSGSLAYDGNGIVKRIIAGDYSARFGQGTCINTGIRTGLSMTSPGYMSASDEIKSYTSTDENRFFRGVAADFSLKNARMILFYSRKLTDATLGSSSGSSKDIIESFYTSGIHNTSSLLEKKDAVSEVTYGINLSYNFDKLRLGLSWSENRLSIPVKTPGSDPEKIFSFNGDVNDIYSAYYNFIIRKILVFGEFSASAGNSYAYVNGLSLKPSDRLTINVLYRNYTPGYSSFYGRGPGIRSGSENEKGFLANFTFEAARHLFVSAGSDIHYFPWLKYRCSSPSWGTRHEIRIKYLPVEKIIAQISYSYRMTIYDEDEPARGIPGQQKMISNDIKVSAGYSFSSNLTLTTKIDYKIACPSGSTGILLSEDVIYKLRKLPVTLWLRYCIFNTDSYDSRLYAYENDLLYSFSIPALSGKGSRSYVMAKWEISDNAEFRVKYGITTIAKGNGGENREEIKLQIRLMF